MKNTSSPQKPTKRLLLPITVQKKFKVVKSAKKVMCTVFYDFKGVIHEEYFEPTKTNKTITAAHYCDTLMRLRTAIKRK